MDYSACTPNTACYYYFISCVTSSSQFHFLHPPFYQCSLSSPLHILALFLGQPVWQYSSLTFVSQPFSPKNSPFPITCGAFLAFCSPLLDSWGGYYSFIYSKLLTQLHERYVSIPFFLSFPLISRSGFYVPGIVTKQLHPPFLRLPTRHRILVGKPQLAGKPTPCCPHTSPQWDLKTIRKKKARK